MKEDLIAPCGMNCSLCIAYQFSELDLNNKGFHKTYCPGCVPRGKNCTYMGENCKQITKGLIRFCYECLEFPCERLKYLDKRYQTKYHMSMIENLKNIKAQGMNCFLKGQEIKWLCNECGGVICCHNGLCLTCNLDILKTNKKYHWDKESGGE